MPVYEYKCDQCGRRAERLRPVARRNDDVVCRVCYPKHDAPIGIMRRVFSVPGLIVRPSGWNLRPGDAGYADFNRELELGEVRGPSAAPVYTTDDYSVPDPVLPTPSHEALRELHQFGEVFDNAVRERADLPGE